MSSLYIAKEQPNPVGSPFDGKSAAATMMMYGGAPRKQKGGKTSLCSAWLILRLRLQHPIRLVTSFSKDSREKAALRYIPKAR